MATNVTGVGVLLVSQRLRTSSPTRLGARDGAFRKSVGPIPAVLGQRSEGAQAEEQGTTNDGHESHRNRRVILLHRAGLHRHAKTGIPGVERDGICGCELGGGENADCGRESMNVNECAMTVAAGACQTATPQAA